MSKSKLMLFGFLVSAGIFISSERIQAQTYTPKAGDLIKTQTNATVFLVTDDLQRVPLSREAYVVRYGNNWSLIKVVADSQIGAYDYTGTINAGMSHSSGTLIMYVTDRPTIYILENGFKRPFATMDALTRVYAKHNLEWVGTYEVYPTGSVIN